MSENRLFWAAMMSGNLLFVLTGAIWWRAGWKWALIFALAGPVVMIGAAVIALVIYFLVDGGVRAPEPCAGKCGRDAPVQLRGQRYRRAYCDACERKIQQLEGVVNL